MSYVKHDLLMPYTIPFILSQFFSEVSVGFSYKAVWLSNFVHSVYPSPHISTYQSCLYHQTSAYRSLIGRCSRCSPRTDYPWPSPQENTKYNAENQQKRRSKLNKDRNFTLKWNPRLVSDRSAPPKPILTNNLKLFWDWHTILRTDQCCSGIDTRSLPNRTWCFWDRHMTLAEPEKL